MKSISVFVLSENFQFSEAKCSIYLNWRVFIMNGDIKMVKRNVKNSQLAKNQRFFYI